MPSSLTAFLQQLCDHFDLGPLEGFADAGGYANQNFVIETARGSYLARILREHEPGALESEALYLERIASTGFPCPRYLTGRAGSRLYAGEGQSAAVMPVLEGKASDQISLEGIRALGMALARLHLIEADALPVRSTWWRSGFLGKALTQAERRFGTAPLSRLADQIAALTDLEGEALPRSIVHGDPWPGNALFDGGRLVALIDWEEATLGFPILDLAYLALHGCLSGHDFDAHLFEALIVAYQTVRPLSSGEQRCFGQAVRRVASTNYLWLLLKAPPEQRDLETLWASQWYGALALDQLTI